jgi:magnesium chelatase subunit D
MALNRMNSAKGAALRLLNESYMNRDQVCIIPFRGEQADVLLPPSRSIAMAKNRLDTMPCGGGSPLAHGLETAALQGLNAMKRGDVGRVMVVMLSDGRGNISLARSRGEDESPGSNGDSSKDDNEESDEESEDDIKQEILDTAQKVGSQGFSFLAIDTESRFVGSGFARDIASAANGKYYYLPNADDARVAAATSEALSEMRG